MIIALILAQIGTSSVPPPAPKAHADFSCRIFDVASKPSKLAGTVRLSGKSWEFKVDVKVEPEWTELPSIDRFETEAYGDSFKAISISSNRDVHYYFTMPQSNGTNGYVTVLDIPKQANGLGTATWVATGLCEFEFKATDK